MRFVVEYFLPGASPSPTGGDSGSASSSSQAAQKARDKLQEFVEAGKKLFNEFFGTLDKEETNLTWKSVIAVERPVVEEVMYYRTYGCGSAKPSAKTQLGIPFETRV